jgi:TolB-like protein
MDTAPVNTPIHAQGKPGWMAIALVASFVLAAVVMFAIGARLVRRSPGPDVSAIAVVPFSDLAPTPADPRFGTLFARQLAEAVSKTPGMHLVERPQAATLIEGRMQTSGNQLNVEIWLVRASDRRALWSKDYAFTPADSPTVQAQIVRAVANALHLQPAETPPK